MRAPPPGAAPSTRRPPADSAVRPATSTTSSIRSPASRTVILNGVRSGVWLNTLSISTSTAMAERGRSGAGSTGLGLDVARRTVEDVGGRLVLDTAAGGGARIVLELPRA